MLFLSGNSLLNAAVREGMWWGEGLEIAHGEERGFIGEATEIFSAAQ